MKNILVTGGTGFIGSNICKYLIKKNIIRLYLITIQEETSKG